MGGLRTSVTSIDDYINSQDGFNSTILTSKKENEDPYVEFIPKKFDFWCYSSDLKDYLEANISKTDIVHAHGVFMYPQYISCKIAESQKIPYLITAHGMLEPYLNKGSIKKKVYSKLLLNNMLNKASAIHAITPFEKDNLFGLTKHKNIVEIPNFISFSEIPMLETYSPDEEYLLYLGRIHEGKGLEILIQSMLRIDDRNIKLKIVGTENEYSEELKKLSRNLNIEDRIVFTGGVYGNEKYKLFSNAKVLIAPSFSEVIGMVNLEAAACKTPVITTFNTGINPDWNISGGIMINPNTEELINAINQSVNWSTEERNQRGNNLSDFVLKNYSWEKKGYMWNDFYNSLLK
jgi:glycosyltransferase involved in cell wall biosynthesis